MFRFQVKYAAQSGRADSGQQGMRSVVPRREEGRVVDRRLFAVCRARERRQRRLSGEILPRASFPASAKKKSFDIAEGQRWSVDGQKRHPSPSGGRGLVRQRMRPTPSSRSVHPHQQLLGLGFGHRCLNCLTLHCDRIERCCSKALRAVIYFNRDVSL